MIIVEASRIQRFPVQLEPREFCRTAIHLKTLECLTNEELRGIAETYNLELMARESERGNTQSNTKES